MARQARIEFPGALYHVISRGIERRELFRDDADRRKCLALPERAVGRFGAGTTIEDRTLPWPRPIDPMARRQAPRAGNEGEPAAPGPYEKDPGEIRGLGQYYMKTRPSLEFRPSPEFT